ncbi:aspartate aminotransferase [Striga asiatica]|uniref:Aspartate aminotransferase n=1 Tax=Striga asiatica TaxID=4170 RepID=A0A5A7P4Q1_STRAF|nr:aspartate aminotransferase [Striga asiatica]
MEKPTRDAHLHFGLIGYRKLGETTGSSAAEREIGRDGEGGDGRRVHSEFLDSSAELAGGAAAPREQLKSGRFLCVGGREGGGAGVVVEQRRRFGGGGGKSAVPGEMRAGRTHGRENAATKGHRRL